MRSFSLLFVFICGSLPAQRTSPAHYARAEGTFADWQAFGGSSSVGWRYQQVHDDLSGKAATIRSLALRPDARGGRYTAYSLVVTLTLSTAAVTSATMKNSFTANHGSNRRVVIRSKRVQFPAHHTEAVADAFVYRIVFDQPYAFDGKGPLCWEAVTTGDKGRRTTIYYDAAFASSSNPALATARFGSGCFHSANNQPARADGSSGPNWRAKVVNVILRGSWLAANQAALAVLGFSRTAFGAIQLPLVLPGSTTRYSGPCSLYVSPDFLFPVVANSLGSATVSVPVPSDPARVNGFKLRGQFFAPDRASGNPIPWIASNGVEWGWTAPFTKTPVSHVVARNAFATTGQLVRSAGYIVRFD